MLEVKIHITKGVLFWKKYKRKSFELNIISFVTLYDIRQKNKKSL